MGEAIADQDIFLLAWSKNTADSHFVEFEWITALALKKSVVPCLLDSTPLPPSLRAAHTIPINDLLRLIAALAGVGGTADAGLRAEVVSKLNQIAATEPQDALRAAKTFFDQRNWMVQGSVIRGENVTVHIGPETEKPAKSLAEKWQVWVGIVVGLLTVVTLAVELPRKMDHTQPATTPKPVEEAKSKHQTLSGAIRSEANDPLPDVQVSLPQFKITAKTDQFGQFRFKVTASDQKTVALLAQKPGYQTYEADVTLGNTALGFTMAKKAMRRRVVIATTLFCLILPAISYAKERLLQGQVLLVGEQDELKPVVGQDVILIESGDTARTKEGGRFRIFLKDIFKAGTKITLSLEKKGWRIQYLLDGEARVPDDLDKELVGIRMLPVGSKKFWSADRIEKFIRDTAEKSKEQVRLEGKPQQIDFSRYIKDWAVKYGFSPRRRKPRSING